MDAEMNQEEVDAKMNQEHLISEVQKYLLSKKVAKYLKQCKMKDLMSEEDKSVEIVAQSICCCAQEIQSQLQPMLKVPLILSLLHAIVIYCKDQGKDPTEHLCARDLLHQIANVSKLQQCESSTKVMTQLKITYIDALWKAASKELPGGGCLVDPVSLEWHLKSAKQSHADGNKLFEKKEYTGAFKCYKHGEKLLRDIKPIECWKHQLSLKIIKPRIILLSNTALAALRMKKLSECISACNKALELGAALLLEGMENKLLFRRAKARSIQSRSKLGADRDLAMDDCRQILTSKHVTDDLKVQTLKLIKKYKLGSPPAETKVEVEPTDKAADNEVNAEVTKALSVIKSLKCAFSSAEVENQLIKDRIETYFDEFQFVRRLPKALFQARLRVAMQHGFVSRDGGANNMPQEIVGNESKVATEVDTKQKLSPEIQQSAVDAMLTFLNRICGRHEGPRMKYKKLHVQVMGEIWSQSDVSSSRIVGFKRPNDTPQPPVLNE